jgi:outer membrane protein
MNVTDFRPMIRRGLMLAILAALALFIARRATAQTPAVQRLTLGEAVRLAARQSAAVEGANLRTEQARARISQHRADLLPNVSAGATEAGQTINSATFGFNFPSVGGQPPLLNPNGQIIGPVNTLDLRGRVSQTIYDPAAVKRIHASEAAADAVGADASTLREQAATDAAFNYFTVLRAAARLNARLADSSLAAELLGIARDQLTAGVGVALDVTRAESQLAGVNAQLIAARNDRERSRLTLLRALNLPLDTPVQLADSLGALPDVPEARNPEAAIDEAMRNRPDVKAAEQQLRAAQSQVGAVQSERLPTIDAFAADGAIGTSLSHMLGTYNWGVQLSWPVFDGRRRESRVREQEASAREIEVRERDLRQQIGVDVRSAVLDLSSARQAVDAARERVRLAEQEVSQARDRFQSGVAGNADVITASLTLNGARTDLIDALASYQGARVSLARAEGRASSLQ